MFILVYNKISEYKIIKIHINKKIKDFLQIESIG